MFPPDAQSVPEPILSVRQIGCACGHLLHFGCFEGQAKTPLEFCTVELAAEQRRLVCFLEVDLYCMPLVDNGAIEGGCLLISDTVTRLDQDDSQRPLCKHA